jgi:hypothetical protein
MHSNKLVLFGLSPEHAAIKNHATNPIIKIVFEEDRTQNITGKRKCKSFSLLKFRGGHYD